MNSGTHENDIALVKLKTKPAGNTKVISRGSPTIPVGEPLEVTGWGAITESGQVSKLLLKATVPYVDNTTCNEPASYNGRVPPKMMCAGRREGGVDSCQGDSGGPLVWKTSESSVLVGVVSFGEGCARKLKYGVYTRVSAYLDWIARVTTADRN